MFSKEEYEEILRLLKKDPRTEAKTYIASMVTLSSKLKSHDWIMNTRATNPIMPDLSSLSNVSIYRGSANIQLPNGEVARVTHLGSCTLGTEKRLERVLRVPYFKFNLVSISRLTKNLKCYVTFFPDFALFQEKDIGDW